MPYEKPWGSTQPGCIIILLDQSGSMSDPFGGTKLGAGKRKCDMVATVLNGFLHELVETNTVGEEVKPRAEIAVIGYSGSGVQTVLGEPLASKTFVSLPELRNEPLRVEQRTRQEMDDTGNVFPITVYFPIWVEPVAGGGTPMCEALRYAGNLATQWVECHPNNYPPVIINVTDGMATDGDPSIPAGDLTSIWTSDGAALLFNCHITDLTAPEAAFVGDEAGVPNDQYARLLFRMSSAIPDTARNSISQITQTSLPLGARGFIFNGDANSVKQMFTFASIQATMPMVDPNR